jgi:integrase
VAKTQGSIVKSKSGKDRWLVRVFLGRDKDKHRMYLSKTVEGGKKDALRVLRGLLSEKDKNRLVRPSTMTLEEYLTQWLRDAVTPRTRASTAEIYRQTLWKYVVPAIGQVTLGKVTPLHVQKIVADMAKAGLAPKTILNAVSLLKTALRQAVRWKMLPTNPAEDTQLPKRSRRELNVPTLEELHRLLAEAEKDRLWPLWLLLVETGMRPGEALGLQWGDIKWESGLISVQRSLSRVARQGWQLTEPKTTRGRRTVTAADRTLDALRDHRTRQLEERMRLGPHYQDHGFVFATELGTPLSWTDVRAHHWVQIKERAAMACTECGGQLVRHGEGKAEHADGGRRGHPASPSQALQALRPYDLRHLHATLALAAGVPIRAISERLGHFDAGFTLSTYAHTMPGTQEAAAVAVDEALFGRAKR